MANVPFTRTYHFRHPRRVAPPPPPPPPPPPAGTRTFLQSNTDATAAGIPSQLAIPRPSTRSRGMRRPPAQNTCYQLSTLQALVHLPKFMNWIRGHNEPDPAGVIQNPCRFDPNKPNSDPRGFGCCAACVVKDLVIEYWSINHLDGNGNPLPISHNHLTLRNIRSRLGDRFFPPVITNDTIVREQQDAGDFQTKLLYACLDSVDPDYLAANPNWTNEFEALFHLQVQEKRQCACGNIKRNLPKGQQEPTLGFIDEKVLYMQDVPTDSLQDAIQRHFDIETMNLRCHARACRRTLPHTVTRAIMQAPAILRIKLNIARDARNAQDTTTVNQNAAVYEKMDHPFRIPNVLYLNQFQVRPYGDLTYMLSSVVSHQGGPTLESGHYIATVRGEQDVYTINDDLVVRKNQTYLRSNPQVWTPNDRTRESVHPHDLERADDDSEDDKDTNEGESDDSFEFPEWLPLEGVKVILALPPSERQHAVNTYGVSIGVLAWEDEWEGGEDDDDEEEEECDEIDEHEAFEIPDWVPFELRNLLAMLPPNERREALEAQQIQGLPLNDHIQVIEEPDENFNTVLLTYTRV